MYLRISEPVANERWAPKMNDFFKDSDGNWWFKTVGKDNKARQIAISQAMLNALEHYRNVYLGLTPLLQLDEDTPLIGRINNPNISVVATVHWLRHTGISEDVKIRPREHVRDDAGHSSSAITDRYIDVELKERAKSADDKSI